MNRPDETGARRETAAERRNDESRQHETQRAVWEALRRACFGIRSVADTDVARAELGLQAGAPPEAVIEATRARWAQVWSSLAELPHETTGFL